MIGGDQDGQTKIRLIYQRPRKAHMGKCIPLWLPEPFSKFSPAEGLGERALDRAAEEADSLHDHSICVNVGLALASITNRTCWSVVALKLS